MEAASTSETSVNFYRTTRRNNPEDSHTNTRRRENLKSHYLVTSYTIIFNFMLYTQSLTTLKLHFRYLSFINIFIKENSTTIRNYLSN
jgi:hypothetical protein